MISFITPTYNHEKYIERCIKSVLAQNYDDIEQIIVDDGSTDNTGEIAKSYESDTIHYYRQNNKGIGKLAETYNFAVSKAKGDIIVVLEGDDAACDIRASMHKKAFLNKNVVLSWGITVRNEDGNILDSRPTNPADYFSMTHIDYVRKMLTGCWISANTVAVRRKNLENIGGFQQGAYYVDYPTWLKLLPEGDFHFSDQVLSIWGVHGDSFSSVLGHSSRIDIDAMRAYDSYPESLKSVISRHELVKYWKNLLFIDRMVQSRNMIKNGMVLSGMKKCFEAINGNMFYEY